MIPNDIELLTTVARLRRAQPRNPDVLEVCDGLERRIQNDNLKSRPAAVPPMAQKRKRNRPRKTGVNT